MSAPNLGKKGGERFTIPSKYLLFLFTIISLLLMALTFRMTAVAEPFNTVAGVIVTPIQKGITTMGAWLKDVSDDLAEINRLQEENEALRARVDELNAQNTALQQDVYELNELRALYELDQQYNDYETIGARVIAKDAGNWYHSFVIDKGAEEGVERDMNILAGSGLVGRVIDVGPHWAKVMTIIADNSSVSGTVLSSADNLMVTGDLTLYESGLLGFSKLVDNADRVAAGDKVVTSNISDKYLPGILIGYISTVTEDSNHLTKSGTLTPAVDFDHLNDVLIVLTKKTIMEEEAAQ